MSTHNICFCGELAKIIFQVSSNTHLIPILSWLSFYLYRCHCGETIAEHAGMQGPFDHFSSAEMMEEYLVPKGIYRNNPKYLDRQVWANSVDPDHTASRSSLIRFYTIFCFYLHLLDSFIHVYWKSHCWNFRKVLVSFRVSEFFHVFFIVADAGIFVPSVLIYWIKLNICQA